MSSPIVIFDGECGLCNRAVARLIKIDKHGIFRITGSDSEAGRLLMEQAGLDPAICADTVVVVDGTESWTKSAAVVKVLSMLPLPWRTLAALQVVPTSLRDRGYTAVANHRRKISGADAACGVPPTALKDLWMQRVVTADEVHKPTSGAEFQFVFTARSKLPLWLFGIKPSTAFVRVDHARFVARFGDFWVDTELANLKCVQKTSNYRWWKALGVRGSMKDTGLTFGSTATVGGVCICFHQKVAGMTRLKQHLGLTVTVEDQDRLVSAVNDVISRLSPPSAT